mmetsp:Transcript_66317/g.130670  ORF Transcript_66317/g.130670 Transcript_66317/m.130670 type:complete len:115 (-) Transcript_66317:47-391(-)
MAKARLLAAAELGDVATCCKELTAETRSCPELLEACDRLGRTPLILAAKAGHHEVCELLCQAGADVEATDRHNNTPLTYAARSRHGDVARVLLDYGADIEATDCIVRDYACALL